jgi:hypothetical protein
MSSVVSRVLTQVVSWLLERSYAVVPGTMLLSQSWIVSSWMTSRVHHIPQTTPEGVHRLPYQEIGKLFYIGGGLTGDNYGRVVDSSAWRIRRCARESL